MFLPRTLYSNPVSNPAVLQGHRFGGGGWSTPIYLATSISGMEIPNRLENVRFGPLGRVH